ncbi:MAG: IPTL-CTERM sorting domain-containing protein [Deltaproteobacteria bacterium]|nr:IPTL-CTERM sorting domain-containing protein [Deltaproteobacteria bacterium]
MERAFRLLFLTVFLLAGSDRASAWNVVEPTEGDGSQGNPYQIATLANLAWIAADSSRWNDHYIQTADIDATDTSNWNEGAGWTPIGTATTYFSGTYNGDKHIIDGLFINRPGSDFQGMFGHALGAVIKNLGLTNVDVAGGWIVGALVGKNYNSILENCRTTGAVNGISGVGGLAGFNHTGTIRTSYAGTETSGADSIGGLVGENQGGVEDCYAMGAVSGNDAVGGLVGRNIEIVTRSYAAGAVSGSSAVGGLVGINDVHSGTVSYSFYDRDVASQSDIGKGEPKNSAQMKTRTTFTDAGWDFVDIWGMFGVTNAGYPYLIKVSVPRPPIVTTQNATEIMSFAAEGHGSITELGVPRPTAHGVCWSTSQNPDTDDDCVDLGPSEATGAFNLTMTDLLPNTVYYARAFAANTQGTVYGEEISFRSKPASSRPGGSGTQDDPYLIGNLDELCWMALHPEECDKYYLQIDTVDASDTFNWYEGTGWMPILSFSGTYDGGGFEISRLFIDRPDAEGGQGLFSELNSAAIRNVHLRDVDITGRNAVGSLAASICNESTVTSCSAGGQVSGTEVVGGLVGGCVQGIGSQVTNIIKKSFSDCVVNGAGRFVGGLVGMTYNGIPTLIDTYATGAVSGSNSTGGLVGIMFSGTPTLTNSYATGAVSGSNPFGGLVGENLGGTVSDSFWDIQTGGPDNGIGIGKTTIEMKTQSTFTDVGWNFNNIWGMVGNINSGYPYLRRASAVATREVTGITQTTATGHGTIANLGAPYPTGHGVCWAVSPDPTTADFYVDNGGATSIGDFSVNMTGLNPSTTYYVRAYSSNGVGTGYGRQVVFSTSAPDNAPEVTTQDVSDISADTATGHGTITSLGVPDPTAYGVCWATTVFPTTADSSSNEGSANATGSFATHITGLDSSTTYYVRAYALNAAGVCYGEQVSFTTADVFPLVTTQDVSDITAATATGHGTIISLGTPDPRDHGVCWNTTGSPNVDDDNCRNLGPATATGAFTAAVTGLNSGTTYYVRAYVTNRAGTSYGQQVSFIAGAPEVTTQEVSDISAASAMGHGTIVNLGTSNATAHGLCWAPTSDPCGVGYYVDKGSTSSTGPFTIDMLGLAPDTTYYVQAYATNAAGTSYGRQRSFTTAASPSLPGLSTQAATDISATTAVGHGTISDLGSPSPTAHGLCWATTPNPSAAGYCNNKGPTTSTGSFAAHIIGLIPGAIHYVQGFAANAAGTVYGNQVEFTAAQADSVSYHSNGATAGSAPDDQTKISGEKLTLRSNSGNLSRIGCTFVGWNTVADGSGTDYAENAEYSTDAALVLHAKWSGNEYIVTFDKQGGTGGSDNATVTYGSAMPNAAAPVRIGYTFAGYYTEAHGEGTQYYTASMTSVRNWDLPENKILYAHWSTSVVVIFPQERVHAPDAVADQSIEVTADTGTSWTATTDSTWIILTNGTLGTGSGMIEYALASNNSIAPRMGTISIADKRFAVTQGTYQWSLVQGPGNGCQGLITGGPYFIHADSQSAVGNVPANTLFPWGLLNFTIHNVAHGGTVTVTISTPADIPVGSTFYKCSSGVYTPYQGVTGLDDGDNRFTLTLTDGGEGDQDGLENGEIVDPGGIGVHGAQPIPTLSEWGMIIMAVMMLSISAVMSRRRLRSM